MPRPARGRSAAPERNPKWGGALCRHIATLLLNGLRAYGTEPQIWGGDENCEHSWDEIITRNDNASGGPPKKQTSNKGSRHVDYHNRTKKSNVCSKCGAWRGELGSEPTLERFIQNLVLVFREVWRVLRSDGVLFVNMGDSYSSGGRATQVVQSVRKKDKGQGTAARPPANLPGYKPKDRLGVPHEMVFALRRDGWYWRDEIVWDKVNSIPESVTDRCVKMHEFIFMLTKSPTYFYDHVAIQEAAATDGEKRNKRSIWSATIASEKDTHFAAYPKDLIEPCIAAGTSQRGVCPKCGAQFRRYVKKIRVPTRSGENSKLNRGSVHASSPYERQNGKIIGNRDPQRHITRVQTLGWYPSCVCAGNAPMIKIPKKGIGLFRKRRLFRHRLRLLEAAKQFETVPAVVLDPFGGTGTTGAAAISKNRKAILIELNPEYVKFIHKKLKRAKQNKGFGLL